MLASIKRNLEQWFNNSGLEGIYIVGSYSLGEQNEHSDVDFVGISKKKLTVEKISLLQNHLKAELSNILEPERIGFRIRGVRELETFQAKLKSWGYDLFDAHRLFGIELNEVLNPISNIPFDKKIILDNLVEKGWYDLLFIRASNNQTIINYLCAKTILDLLNFILYLNDIFISTNYERVKFIAQNWKYVAFLPLEINELEELLNVKTNPNLYQSEMGLLEKRSQVFRATYDQYLPIFNRISKDFDQLDYWSYDERILSYLKKASKGDNNNLNFAWRLELISLFLNIDFLLLSLDTSLMYSAVRGQIESIFGPIYSDYVNENHFVISLLRNLEVIRIAGSKSGIDITKYLNSTVITHV